MKRFLATAALVVATVGAFAAPASAATVHHSKTVTNSTNVTVTNTNVQHGQNNSNSFVFTYNGVNTPAGSSHTCTQTTTVNGVTTVTSC